MTYPVFLNIRGRRCLVVGGGRVAVRKIIALLRAGASVIAVAKEICPRMNSIADRIILYKRPFEESDVDGSLALVIGATDDENVNRRISQLAASRNILCNIVDRPELCSFFVPAQVRRGEITVAVSTGAASPRTARYLKNVISRAIEPLHEELTSYMAELRKRIRPLITSVHMRNKFWDELFSDDPVKEITEKGWDEFRSKTERLIYRYSSDGEKG